jgi:hypothetical protein
MHGLETKWHGIKIPPVNTFGKFVIWNFHHVGRHPKVVLQLNHYWSKAFGSWKMKYEKGSIEKGIFINWCSSQSARIWHKEVFKMWKL